MTRKAELAEIERVDELVLAFGADAARWPADARAMLAAVAATNPAAVPLVREAAALDRLLSAAATAMDRAQPQRSDLIDRIMTALPASQPAAALSTVIAFDTPHAGSDGARRRQVSHSRLAVATTRSRARLNAATVLAASLLVGVIAGGAAHESGLAYDVTARLGIIDLVYADTAWPGDTGAIGEDEDTL